ncbi:MAG: glycosyltransferase [Dysgonamonadaceae bacterium]|jgi:glycosyltransferase involved in cell wall biosynthesis|nr:glycosyltransferase [Dysgonamonadaceae bacterium]
MTSEPLVSIVTVTYNAGKYIEQTMRSVFAQSYCNIEYIIIDGGSTDETVRMIKDQGLKVNIFVSEPDMGIYDAMNKGIRLCRGELIGIINASDYYESGAVENVVRAYNDDPAAGIFHGNINMLNPDGSFFKTKKPVEDPACLTEGMSLFHPTFFVRRKVYDNQGLYSTDLKLAADFDFALRCFLAGVKFHYIDMALSNFRKGGVSSVRDIDSLLESRDALLMNGFSREVANSVHRRLDKLRKRNIRYETVYYMLGKILSKRILNFLSRRFSIR